VRDGETGYLIPPKDPEALAERLAYLYHNTKALQKLSQKASKRANTLFTWRKVATMVGSLYDEIVDRTPATVSPAEAGAASPLEVVNQSFTEAVETLQYSQLALSEQVLKAAGAIVDCLVQGGKVMVCGNGGSAADSQHFAGELVGRFKRPGRGGLPVMALTADAAFLTAWANDVDYEDVFARQVEAFGRPGDLLIGISTTGRSRNLINAFILARRRKIGCLALLGGDGGELARLADLALVVPSANTPRVQEVQILILHMLCELVEEHFMPGQFTPAEFVPRPRYVYPSLFGSVAAEAQPPWDMQSADLQSAVISVKAIAEDHRRRPPTTERGPLRG
jgi:D-inositol-3-phosphate glycosyltransferase